MSAGALRERVAIQVRSTSVDSGPGRTVAWMTLDTAWAAVEQSFAGPETTTAGAVQSDVTYLVRMRTRTDVNAQTRLVWNGKVLHVQAVRNLDSAYIEITSTYTEDNITDDEYVEGQAATGSRAVLIGNTTVNGTLTVTGSMTGNGANLTSVNAITLGGKTAAALNVNSALSANNATYAFGKTEVALNVNSALRANNSTYAYGKAEYNLDANSAVRLRATDDRAIAPVDGYPVAVRSFFTTWNQDAVSPYADALLFNTYSDATGGNTNLLVLKKIGGIGLRVYQGAHGNTNTYSTYKDAYFQGDAINAAWITTGTVPFGQLPVANTTANGIVTNTAQSFAGVKTFNANVLFNTDTVTHRGNDGAYPAAQIYSHSNTSWHGYYLSPYRSRGTSAARAAVVNDDTIFSYDMFAHDGTAYVKGGQLLSLVAGTVNTGIVPMSWVFKTLDATGNLATRLTIHNTGNVVQVAGHLSATKFFGDASALNANSALSANNANYLGTVAANNYAREIYVQSRGMNLITNGLGLLGNNKNFTYFTFHQADTYGGKGSFKYTNDGSPTNDELIPVDGTLTYKLSLWAKATAVVNAGATYAYFGVRCYDIDGLDVDPRYFMRVPGTDTTLAQPLRPGDTRIYLTSSANWLANTTVFAHQVTIWKWKNSFGYEYPAYTYSRYSTYGYVGNSDLFTNGSINTTSHYIDLAVPFPTQCGNPDDVNGEWAAGTPISQSNSGGTYKYIVPNSPNQVPEAWTNYTGTIGGWDTTGSNVFNKFPYGTAYVRLLTLLNRALTTPFKSNNSTLLSGLWFSELTTTNLEEANTTVKGVVNTSTQTFGGNKTFVDNVTVNGYIQTNRTYGTRIADPAAPASTQGVVYFRDNGSGKTQLCVRFGTGAVQVIATEP